MLIFRKEEREDETNHKNEIREIKLITKRLENDIKDIRLASMEMKKEKREEETNHKNEIREIKLINKRLENDIKDIRISNMEMKTLLLKLWTKLEDENPQ